MRSAGKYISLLRHEGNERKTRQMGDTKVEVLLQWLEVCIYSSEWHFQCLLPCRTTQLMYTSSISPRYSRCPEDLTNVLNRFPSRRKKWHCFHPCLWVSILLRCSCIWFFFVLLLPTACYWTTWMGACWCHLHASAVYANTRTQLSKNDLVWTLEQQEQAINTTAKLLANTWTNRKLALAAGLKSCTPSL